MLSKSKVKYIQSLGQKKFREAEGAFIAEGPKIIAELLAARRGAVRELFALKEWISENRQLIGQSSCTEVSEQELEKISQLSTPNQVMAVVEEFGNPGELVTKGCITLVLDGIRDPGNMGTILRIADWFGVEQLVCSKDSANLYNPKVVQASMGSIARVKVLYTDPGNWLSLQTETRIYAAVLEGQDITQMNKPAEGIIIIGNESQGIRPELLRYANEKITIPRKGKAESLNAAVATGIILSHIC